jgi:hypothetical protein
MSLLAESILVSHLFVQFAYLQLLDLMTTVAFLVNGVEEANPFVSFVMHQSPNPIGGLLAVKVFAIILGLYCWRMGRTRLLSGMNVLFALVVAWNLAALIVRSMASA